MTQMKQTPTWINNNTSVLYRAFQKKLKDALQL